MAVFTKISQSQLDEFLAAYALGEVQALTPIAEGTENTNYALETSAGQYVLTVFERRTPPEALPFVVALMRHLAAAGQPVPQPIDDRNGTALKTLVGKPALIVSFLSGRWAPDPSPAHCEAAGEAVARLHLAVAEFAHHRDNPYGISAWSELVTACEHQADRGTDALLTPIRHAIAHLERNWPGGLPRGACHTDLFPDNVFFTNGQVSGLIDFYFSCTELFAYDLAVCIASWSFDAENRYRPERAQALIAGYERARPLGRNERSALPLLSLGATVRFALTRLYDRLHPRPGALVVQKDPAEFAARLETFQQLLDAGEGFT